MSPTVSLAIASPTITALIATTVSVAFLGAMNWVLDWITKRYFPDPHPV